MVLPKKCAPLEASKHTRPRVMRTVHTHTNRINRSHCNWIKFTSHEKCFCHEATAKKNGVIFQVNRVYRCYVPRVDGNREMHEKCSFQQKIETIERHEINTFFSQRFSYLFLPCCIFKSSVKLSGLKIWHLELYNYL